MQDAMDRLAKGDTTNEIPYIDRKDEIGKMAKSVNVFKVNAIERVRLEREAKDNQVTQEEKEQYGEPRCRSSRLPGKTLHLPCRQKGS